MSDTSVNHLVVAERRFPTVIQLLFVSTAVFNLEEDIGTYTIKAVDDTKTLNKILYIRPRHNIITLNEVVSLWEKKTGKNLERIYVPEEQVLKNMQGKAFWP